MKTTLVKTVAATLMVWSAWSVAARADTAFFDGSVMHVPELLVYQDDTPQLLQQVQLQRKHASYFELVYASEVGYANVQSMSADSEIVRGDPLVVHIEGFKSLECVTLNPVSVNRVGDEFHLVVTEQPVPAHVTCLVGEHPFELDFTIATDALGAGTYVIHAHGLYIEVLIQ